MDNSLKIEVADDAVTEPKARALERLAPTKRSAVERSRTVLRFKSAAFQSLCAVQQRRKGQVLRAAASLLHAAAYGLRASLASNQQAGGAMLLIFPEGANLCAAKSSAVSYTHLTLPTSDIV